MNKRTVNAILTALSIVAGNSLLAFTVAAFIIPHGIIMGGTTGIGIVMNRIFPIVDIPVFVLALNILFLILGLIVLGKKLFLTTVASSVLYPVFLGLFQMIPGIDTLTDDSLMAAVFAGCLMGIALGLVMRVGSSTGGMDILDLVLHHKLHLPVAFFVYAGDIIIVGGQAVFSNPGATMLGIIVLVLESLLLDRVMILGKAQIQIFVVSEKHELLREAMLERLEAGVTLMMIETGRMQNSGKGIICIIPKRKLYAATELIHETDEDAFITVTQINEVRGRGFTKERLIK